MWEAEDEEVFDLFPAATFQRSRSKSLVQGKEEAHASTSRRGQETAGEIKTHEEEEEIMVPLFTSTNVLLSWQSGLTPRVLHKFQKGPKRTKVNTRTHHFFLHSLGSNELVFFPLSPPTLLKLLPENPLPRRQNTISRAARRPFGFKSGSCYNRCYPVEEKLNKETNKQRKKKSIPWSLLKKGRSQII